MKRPAEMSRKHQLIVNILMFQLVWAACIFGGNLAALLVTPVLLIWHWQIRFPGEGKLIALFTLVGAILDSLLIASGELSIDQHTGPLLPYWLLLLWVAFATTLLHSLFWLVQRPLWVIPAGAVLGPFSYWSGARLQGADITPLGLLIISVEWFVLMAICSRILPPLSSRWHLKRL